MIINMVIIIVYSLLCDKSDKITVIIILPSHMWKLHCQPSELSISWLNDCLKSSIKGLYTLWVPMDTEIILWLFWLFCTPPSILAIINGSEHFLKRGASASATTHPLLDFQLNLFLLFGWVESSSSNCKGLLYFVFPSCAPFTCL